MSVKELKTYSDQSNLIINNLSVQGTGTFQNVSMTNLSAVSINTGGLISTSYIKGYDIISQRNYFKSSTSNPFLIVAAPADLPADIFNYAATVVTSTSPSTARFPSASLMLANLPDFQVGYAIEVYIVNPSGSNNIK